MKIKADLLLTFLGGGSIILFILWNRLIRVRLPKEIQEVGLVFESYVMFIICLFFGFVTLFYFYKIINVNSISQNSFYNKYKVYISDYVNTKNLLRQICIFFKSYIIEGPKKVYEIFYEHFYLKTLIEYIGGKSHDLFYNNKLRLHLINLIIFILPKMILVVTFAVEVIIYKRLDYFYKFLGFLILPIILHVLVYIIQHHAKKSLDYYDYYFKIDGNFETGKVTIIYRELLDSIDIKEQNEFDPETVMKWWEFYQYLYNISYQINLLFDSTKNYINVIYYGTYTVGFIFYLTILLGIY